MKELTPKRVMSIIRRNKDKEIYICPSTKLLLRGNMDCDELKRYHFVICNTDVEVQGKVCPLGRVDLILEYGEEYEDGVETWYEFPEEAEEMLIL